MPNRVDRLLEPGAVLGGALVGALLREHLGLDELAAGAQLGAFRIVRELGRGGMGIVYLAVRDDGAFEQDVAIKWLPVGKVAAMATGQFKHERQILAQLRHPHIARLIDGGSSADGHLWFAMEHVAGIPIDQHVGNAGLDWRQCVQLLLPVIDAVQFAHAHLLVHRDIKPDNVLVDTDGRAMLVDFGVAALLSEVDARTAFTEGFASPEQRVGAPPDIRADVWQLGRLLQAIVNVTNHRQANATIPEDLHAIIAHATHATPDKRYPTAAALQTDLKRLLAHRPVSVRRPGLWGRLRLLTRAHPLGTASSVLALLVFIITLTGMMLRLAHQRDVAEHARNKAEAINAFIEEDLLPGADPLQSGSRDMRVTELAERALARAEARLGRTPEVAAQVELSLGRTLANLGEFKHAERAFTLAIAHLTALYGAYDQRTLAARLQREQQMLDASHLTTAESRLLPLRQHVLARLGSHSTLLLEVDSQIAHAALLRDDFNTCIARYNALLPHVPDTKAVLRGDIYMNLSFCEARIDRHQAALHHANQSVAITTRALGAQHPYVLESKLAQETALVGLGQFDDAANVLRPLVGALDQRYGTTHPVTLLAMHDLGLALICRNQSDQAIAWLQHAADGRARILGRYHPWYALSESVLAMAHIRQHQYDQAQAALTRAHTALGPSGTTSPYVLVALLENEADLALAQDRIPLAQTRYEEALAVADRLYPADHARLSILRLGRGTALIEMGDTTTGKPLVREALQQLRNRPNCRMAAIEHARHLLAGTQ